MKELRIGRSHEITRENVPLVTAHGRSMAEESRAIPDNGRLSSTGEGKNTPAPQHLGVGGGRATPRGRGRRGNLTSIMQFSHVLF